mgnify:CR=1 FL=1
MSSEHLKDNWALLSGAGWVSVRGSIAEETKGWVLYPIEGGKRGPFRTLEEAIKRAEGRAHRYC